MCLITLFLRFSSSTSPSRRSRPLCWAPWRLEMAKGDSSVDSSLGRHQFLPSLHGKKQWFQQATCSSINGSDRYQNQSWWTCVNCVFNGILIPIKNIPGKILFSKAAQVGANHKAFSSPKHNECYPQRIQADTLQIHVACWFLKSPSILYCVCDSQKEKTHTKTLVHCPCRTPHPILALDGFRIEHIKWCSMHCVNLGILQVVNGSVVELLTSSGVLLWSL